MPELPKVLSEQTHILAKDTDPLLGSRGNIYREGMRRDYRHLHRNSIIRMDPGANAWKSGAWLMAHLPRILGSHNLRGTGRSSLPILTSEPALPLLPHESDAEHKGIDEHGESRKLVAARLMIG